MLNLFASIANGLGHMLPGYMQGQRQAIRDNWYDLNQYNQVQQGQIGNAFSELTFPLAYNMYADRAGLSRMGTLGYAMDYLTKARGWPGVIDATDVNSAFAGDLALRRLQNAFTQFDRNAFDSNFQQELMRGITPEMWRNIITGNVGQPTGNVGNPMEDLRQKASAPTVTGS